MLLKIDADTRAAIRALADSLDEIPDGSLVSVESDAGALSTIVLSPDLAVAAQKSALGEKFKVAALDVTPKAVKDKDVIEPLVVAVPPRGGRKSSSP